MSNVLPSLVIPLAGNFPLPFLFLRTLVRDFIPRNYRPIGLLPIISKVFESLINWSLVNHLDSHNLFSDYQYGFRSGRSTEDVLTVRVYRALDACGETRAIALDISKAFDKVWHADLLHKLNASVVSGPFFGYN